MTIFGKCTILYRYPIQRGSSIMMYSLCMMVPVQPQGHGINLQNKKNNVD